MRLFRGFLVLAGAITLVFALLAALAGEYWLGLSNALVGGGLLLFGTWAWSHPAALPVRQWAALGLIGAGFVVVGQVVLALVLLGGLLLINVLTGTFMLRRVSGVEFELLGPDAVMPGAKDLVSEFEAEGFRRAGGYRGRIPLLRKLVTCTVLTGPTRDSFAVVTDRVWEVVSRFGQRWLITTSSGVTPASPGVLRQTVHDARPTELVRAHQAALEHLAASELRPDRLEDDGAVVQSAVAVENDAARFIGRAPMKSVLAMETRGKSDYPVLGDDDRSRRRIDAWLYSAEPG